MNKKRVLIGVSAAALLACAFTLSSNTSGQQAVRNSPPQLEPSREVMAYAANAINGSLRTGRNISLPSHQNTASSSGAISGRVVNAEGQPVFNAKVYALNTEFGMGRVPTAYTDEAGGVVIKNLGPGTYEVSVGKEEDGYPPTHYPFYSVGFVEVPRVTLDEGQTVADVVAHLAPKAAKLVGRTANATTHKPVLIEGVQINIRRVDDPENSYTGVPDVEGKVDILVPPIPLTLEISAPGYETIRLDSLQLAPGETKQLDFTLHPLRGITK